MLLDLASYHIDLLYFLFGQAVRDVFAELRSQRSEDDSAMLQLRLADGLVVQSLFSLNAVEEDRFEVYGQAGKLMVDRYLSLEVEILDATRKFSRSSRLLGKLRALVRTPSLLGKIVAPRREPSYRAALAHFVSAVRARRPPSPDFCDGYRSLAVITAAEESAWTGRTVVLWDLSDEDFAG